MVEVEAIIEYLNKIKKVLDFGAEMHFMNKRYIKKDKVDTLLCCVLAKLPTSFKRKMRVAGNKYSSISAFKLLQDNLTRKAWFGGAMYSVDYARSRQLIDSVLASIRRDIQNLENGDNK